MANSEFQRNESTVDAKHSSWLMLQLQKELQTAPEHVREAAIQEVQEHLACSRMALQELGVPAEETDQQAVQLFGSPKDFARKLLRQCVDAPRNPRALIVVMVLTMLLPASVPFFMLVKAFPFALGILIIGIGAFMIASWRARVFHWKPIGLAGAIVSVVIALCIGFTWIELWSTGGVGELPRWTTKDLKSISNEQMALIQKTRAECDPIQQTFAKGQEAVQRSAYYSHGSYETFVAEDIRTFWGVPSYHLARTDSFIDADNSWRYYESYRTNLKSGLASVKVQIPAADEAVKRVFDPMTASQGAIGGVFMTCVALLVNFFVSMLRLIYESVHRLSRRLVS